MRVIFGISFVVNK